MPLAGLLSLILRVCACPELGPASGSASPMLAKAASAVSSWAASAIGKPVSVGGVFPTSAASVAGAEAA